MGLDGLSENLNIMGGQSSVFGDATQGNRIIYLGKVISNEDASNMGRLLVTIIDFASETGIEQPGKDKNDNTPKMAYPLIPQFVNVIPRVDELVYVFLENPKDQSSRRFYVGPIRSVKKAQTEFESTSSSNELFTVNTFSRENKSVDVKNFILKDNIRLDGKNNANIALKPREVLITAGGLKDNSFEKNEKTECYIQIKDNLEQTRERIARSSLGVNQNITIRDSFSQANIVASNINLISSNKSSRKNRALDENGNLKDLSNVEIGTNPDLETYGELAKELHPLVLGDELVKLLKIIIRFCLNHKHTPQETPYATVEEINLLNEYLSDEKIQEILSKSVRTN
jgi:hypothetical protein